MNWSTLAPGLAIVVILYLVGVLGLVLAGRRHQAEAVARFVPDCAVLFARLARDPRVPRRYKLMLIAVAAYLAMPIDLVPDFIPIAGQLDDAIIVSLALRTLLRVAGDDLLREHWPGPPKSLAAVERLAGNSKVSRLDAHANDRPNVATIGAMSGQHDDRVGPRSWYWPARYKVLLAVVIAALVVLVFILVNPGPGSNYR